MKDSEYEDRVWALTLELAKHQRIAPMTKDDRCSCGFKTGLGRMFSEHIARLIA